MKSSWELQQDQKILPYSEGVLAFSNLTVVLKSSSTEEKEVVRIPLAILHLMLGQIRICIIQNSESSIRMPNAFASNAMRSSARMWLPTRISRTIRRNQKHRNPYSLAGAGIRLAFKEDCDRTVSYSIYGTFPTHSRVHPTIIPVHQPIRPISIQKIFHIHDLLP